MKCGKIASRKMLWVGLFEIVIRNFHFKYDCYSKHKIGFYGFIFRTFVNAIIKPMIIAIILNFIILYYTKICYIAEKYSYDVFRKLT